MCLVGSLKRLRTLEQSHPTNRTCRTKQEVHGAVCRKDCGWTSCGPSQTVSSSPTGATCPFALADNTFGFPDPKKTRKVKTFWLSPFSGSKKPIPATRCSARAPVPCIFRSWLKGSAELVCTWYISASCEITSTLAERNLENAPLGIHEAL